MELAISDCDVSVLHYLCSVSGVRGVKWLMTSREGLGDLEEGRLNCELNNRTRVEYDEGSCAFEMVGDGH